MNCPEELSLTEASNEFTDSRAIALLHAYLTGEVGPGLSGWSDSGPWRCHDETASGNCLHHADCDSDRAGLLHEQLVADTTEPLQIVKTSLPSLELSGAEVTRPVRFVNTEFRGDVHLDGEFTSDIALVNCDVEGAVVLHGSATVDADVSTVDLSFTEAGSIRAEADSVGSRLICRYSAFGRASLQQTTFPGRTDLSNARIAGEADFTNTSFARRVEFHDTEFSGDAYFAGATFDGSPTPKTVAANFSGAKFESRAVFTRSGFPARASFANAVFEGNALFRDAVIVDNSGLNRTVAADFSGTRFEGEARFYDVHLENGARFNDAEFEGEATFTETAFVTTVGATFRSKAEFEEATFSDTASFADCVFEDEGEFSGAEFEAVVDFTNAAFEGKADLEGTEFRGAARFNGVSFARESERNYEDEAEFSGALFENHADFSDTSFEGKADFRGAEFGQLATFWGAVFTLDDDSVFDCSAQFDDAHFYGRFECFDATFDDRVTFVGTTFHRRGGEGGAWLDESRFHDTVAFEGTRVSGPACFRDVSFAAETSFSDARFEREITFTDLTCSARMTFDNVAFDGTVTFDSGEFEGELGFHDGTAFGDEVSLDAAQCRDAVMFRGVDIATEARLSNATFDGMLRFEGLQSAASVDLFGAEVEHLWTRDATLGLSLNLCEATVHKGDLKHAQLHGSDFSDSTLTDVHLEGADLRSSDLTGTDFEKVRIDEETRFLGSATDSDPAAETESALATLSAGLRDALGLNKRRCYNDPYAEFDTVGEGLEQRPLYRRPPSERKSARNTGKTVYKKIGLLAENVSRPELQRVAFVRRQDLTSKQYRDDITSDTTPLDFNPFSLGRWVRSRAARIIMLYGESPWRILFWSAFIVFSAGVIYDAGNYMNIEGGTDPDLFDTVYYSSLIYTSLGFGDFSIVDSPIGRLVATTETLLGLTMLALLVFVLGRRAAR
jgi:uncharacterized protein YjbI with pentapeptide repeats